MKFVIYILIALSSSAAVAWQIEPVVTPTDQKLVRRASIMEWIALTFGDFGDRMVGDPLHEAIILRAEGCDQDNLLLKGSVRNRSR